MRNRLFKCEITAQYQIYNSCCFSAPARTGKHVKTIRSSSRIHCSANDQEYDFISLNISLFQLNFGVMNFEGRNRFRDDNSDNIIIKRLGEVDADGDRSLLWSSGPGGVGGIIR